jgi:hypothetical protein
MSRKTPIYGLLAEFDAPEPLVAAVERAVAAGYRKLDAYSPYPVDALAEALRCRRTRVPLIVFLGGLCGCLGGYFLQYYAAVLGFPLNVGGRPLHSWPSFIPVTFELTVLSAALFGLVGMLALNGLPMPYHPLFNVPRFSLATRNRFFLCIEAADPQFDPQRTRQFLAECQPQQISEVPW